MTESGSQVHAEGERHWQRIKASELRGMSDDDFRRLIQRLLAEDDYEGWLEVSVTRLNAS